MSGENMDKVFFFCSIHRNQGKIVHTVETKMRARLTYSFGGPVPFFQTKLHVSQTAIIEYTEQPKGPKAKYLVFPQ